MKKDASKLNLVYAQGRIIKISVGKEKPVVLKALYKTKSGGTRLECTTCYFKCFSEKRLLEHLESHAK